MDIIGDLKLDFTSEDSILELQGAIKTWFELYLTQAKDVTQNMHTLDCHVPEFLSLYQNIHITHNKAWKNTMIEPLKNASDPHIKRG